MLSIQNHELEYEFSYCKPNNFKHNVGQKMNYNNDKKKRSRVNDLIELNIVFVVFISFCDFKTYLNAAWPSNVGGKLIEETIHRSYEMYFYPIHDIYLTCLIFKGELILGVLCLVVRRYETALKYYTILVIIVNRTRFFLDRDLGM